jgi:nitrogen fixation NifU-like protein
MPYSEIIQKHFSDPQHCGALDGATAIGEAVNEACLDRMRIFVLIDSGVITSCTFLADGCVPTIAAGSVLTEYLHGKRVEEAESITEEFLEELLGGLPSHKKHAAVIAVEALRNALQCYRKSEREFAR